MPNDHRSAHEIEQDIERERHALSNTIEDLQDKFSPEAILRDVSRGFREHSGEFTHAISRSVKENPLGLALTGVGLAWLIFGRSNSGYDASRNRVDYARRYSTDDHDSDFDSIRDRTDDNGYGSDSDYRSGSDYTSRGMSGSYGRGTGFYDRSTQRYGSASRRNVRQPGWVVAVEEENRTYGQNRDDSDDGKSLAQRASSGAASARDSVTGAAKSASDSASSAASRAGQAISGAAESASDRASRIRRSVSQGTENLSEAARERVIAAREKAIQAREKAAASAARTYRNTRDGAVDFFEEQPLVAGGLALAVGAALASALPRTRYEDEMLGEYSDAAIAEAERIFEEERKKAERVASAAVGEASKIAEETRTKMDESVPGQKSAAESAADRVKEAGKRVEDAAKKEADKQKLGNPNV